MRKGLSLILIFLFAVSSLILAQSSAMNPEAAKLYNEGNKLYKSGQYESSIAKYDEALAIEHHPNIFYQKSVALKKNRNFGDAESALKKCLEIDPKFIAAYTGLGTTYYSLRKYDLAVENFSKYVELSTDQKQNKKIQKYIGLSYTQLGQSAKSNNKYDAALANLNKAVNNYKYDAAYLTMAEIYIELGKYNDAVSACDNVVKYRTSKSKISKGAPYYYKGLAYKGLADNVKAKENFNKSVKDSKYKVTSKYELDLLK